MEFLIRGRSTLTPRGGAKGFVAYQSEEVDGVRLIVLVREQLCSEMGNPPSITAEVHIDDRSIDLPSVAFRQDEG